MEERQADRSDSGQSSLSSSDVNISTSQGSQELQGSQGSQAVQDFHDQKASDILDACRWRDIGRLKSLAEAEGGFLTDNLRQRAWPILLGIHVPATESDNDIDHETGSDTIDGCDLAKPLSHASGDWKELPRHRDEDQVQLDVNRSFNFYPANLNDSELNEHKSELSALIIEVLRRFPYLCYFQGYHDICQVFLLVLSPSWRSQVVARLSLLRIRDFMLPSLGPTTAQLKLLPDILEKADPKLRRHVADIEPFYALAGTLTMYAHNIQGYRDIVRLFDVLLAREPVFSIYMFAQIVLDRRDEIFEFDEPDMLLGVLGRVPPVMNLDTLIVNSANLFDKYPPETLRSWKRISDSSALKTARNVELCAKQTLDEGSQYFQRQAKELRWLELRERAKWMLWVYRRPVKAVGMAVTVGVIAFYLRRNPTLINNIMAFFAR